MDGLPAVIGPRCNRIIGDVQPVGGREDLCSLNQGTRMTLLGGARAVAHLDLDVPAMADDRNRGMSHHVGLGTDANVGHLGGQSRERLVVDLDQGREVSEGGRVVSQCGSDRRLTGAESEHVEGADPDERRCTCSVLAGRVHEMAEA